MPRHTIDDLPHAEWQCPNCGTINSEFDAECQWCHDEPIDYDAIRIDHILDHRKHSK
jgi:hypothetical protein